MFDAIRYVVAVGRELRPHGDLDVLALRRGQALVRDLLADWDLYVADPPGQAELRPWPPGEALQPPLHDIWCRRTPEAPWSVQLMLDEAEGTQWASRRDPEVRLPIDRLGRTSKTGVPYLAPKVQLFYKAKATRDKDETDFEAVLPLLGGVAARLAGGRDQGDRAGPPLVPPTAPGQAVRDVAGRPASAPDSPRPGRSDRTPVR
ncbi:hypothetical protein [Streptomyces sp. NPDC002133]|uniref:hypothetical protein n=1 Tax=Streptomyces sp. NPDC002133 TaxID=3154409 RepID=UPI00332A8286